MANDDRRRDDEGTDQGERNGLEQAYDRMLERARHFLEEAEESTQHAIERARQRAVELGELSRDQSEKIAGYLRRDLEEAGDYLANTGRGLRDWLRFDLAYLEKWFLDYLVAATDRTRVELAEFERRTRAAEYHSGEVAAPGTLICQNCGQSITLRKTGHIPPCPKCRGRSFQRPQE